MPLELMHPLEFIVPQRPVSQQARRRDRVREWMDFVALHARQATPESLPLATAPVALRLFYFYDEVSIDIDNVLKPILDALIGIVYEDESVVTDVEIHRRRRSAFIADRVTPVLATGLELGREFVYVSLTDGPPQDVMP